MEIEQTSYTKNYVVTLNDKEYSVEETYTSFNDWWDVIILDLETDEQVSSGSDIHADIVEAIEKLNK